MAGLKQTDLPFAKSPFASVIGTYLALSGCESLTVDDLTLDVVAVLVRVLAELRRVAAVTTTQSTDNINLIQLHFACT
jgi:hypothetical protein